MSYNSFFDLFVEDRDFYFDEANKNNFVTTLQQISENTILVLPHEPEVIIPDITTGFTSLNYKLSKAALRAVCRIACRGLYILLKDLCVAEENERDKLSLNSLSYRIFSDCIKYKFNMPKSISETQLICDDNIAVIDGVVSKTYRRMSNAELVSILLERSLDNYELEFIAGRIFGRYISVFLRCSERFIQYKNQDLYLGYILNHSEITGTAMHLQPALFLPPAGFLFGPGYKVTHHRRRFSDRLFTLLSKRDKLLKLFCKEKFIALCNTPLIKLFNLSKIDKEAIKRIVSTISPKHFLHKLEMVVQQSIFGSEDDADIYTQQNVVTNKTFGDFLIAIASNQHIKNITNNNISLVLFDFVVRNVRRDENE